jgi:hypothetical protein
MIVASASYRQLTCSTAITESAAINADIQALQKQVAELEKLIRALLPKDKLPEKSETKEGKLVDTD